MAVVIVKGLLVFPEDPFCEWHYRVTGVISFDQDYFALMAS